MRSGIEAPLRAKEMNMAGIVSVLRDLVAINSVFPNEGRLGAHLEKRLRGAGFSTARQYISKGRFNILADNNRDGRAVLFYAHIDTVPIYGNWKTDPLRLTKIGGRLHGLGASDMKGGMAAILNNAAASERHVKILMCADEENISRGAWAAMRDKKGWFRDAAIAVSGEPGTTGESVGGARNITIGRRGRTVITVDIRGRSAHGSMPNKGISALNEASKLAVNIGKLRLMKAEGFGSESVFIRELTSSSTSLSIPEAAHLELDIHLVPGSTVENARKRVQELVNRLRAGRILDRDARFVIGVKKRDTPYIEPYVSDTRDRNVVRVFDAVRLSAGPARVRYGLSVADDNIIATQLGIPVLIIGPKGGNIHTTDEWVSNRSLMELDRTYARLMQLEAI